jgi:hypothetical protein
MLFAAVALLWAGVPSHRAATITIGPNDNDVRIGSFDNNYHGHTEDFLSVYNAGSGNTQHSLLQFDLSSIPANQTIGFASLTVFRDSTIWGGGDNGMPTNVFRVTTPWVNTDATWLMASSATPWKTPGGDFVGTAGVQAMDPYGSGMLNINGSGGPNNSGIFALSIDVTSLVNEWYTGVNPNYGLALAADQGVELHFRADRGQDSYLFPGLTIIYGP